MVSSTWKTNQEERASLRMALYEQLHDNPDLTYGEIAKEFNIKSTDAKALIIEYCKVFNLTPPFEKVGVLKRANNVITKNIDKTITVNGRDAIVLNEHLKTIVVRFYDNNEAEVISKKTNQIVRKAKV